MHLVINFLLFQAGWFASVLGAANGMPWLGPIAVAAIVTVHMGLAHGRVAESILMLICGVAGAVFDSLLVASGFVGYATGIFIDGVAPYWIISMWALFATTLNVSMRWLRGRLALAAVVGAVAGPLTYLAGERLGGITLIERQEAMLALGLGWAVMMPALVILSQRFDGIRATSKPAVA